jgi:VWFA-related protein
LKLMGGNLGRARLFGGFESLASCVAVLLLALAFAAWRAAAQTRPAELPAVAAPTTAQRTVPKFHGLEGLIKLDVVVTDRAGKAVTGLGAHDFSVLDNGQPTGVASFSAYDGVSAKPDSPVELILAVDQLSIGNPIGFQAGETDLAKEDIKESAKKKVKEDVIKFLRRDGGQLSQPVVVYTLSAEGHLLIAGPSTDGNALAAEFAQPKSRDTSCRIQGPSGLISQKRDDFAIRELTLPLLCLSRIATIERQRPGRKSMIWVGPELGIGSGEDWVYVKGQQQQLFDQIVWFSTLLREARIALYNTCVGKIDSNWHPYQDDGRRVESAVQTLSKDLRRNVLAVESGGGVLEPTLDLAGVIDGYAKEANSYYSLSINPSHADHLDEYHDLKVSMNQPGLLARTNTGYYDQPYYVYHPNPAARRVTVEELDRMLSDGAAKGDGDLAKQLEGLELTERLSSAKLTNVLARVRGEKSHRALVAVADASVFLRPPVSEIPADPPPSVSEQQRMFSMAGEYLNQTLTRFPDLLAKRSMAHYAEITRVNEELRKIEFEPLHWLDSSEADVLYRQGKEVVEVNTKKRERRGRVLDLNTYGVFGPSLAIMRQIIADPGLVTRSSWEQDASGRRAVFAYKVPMARSLYHITFCCLPDGDGKLELDALVGYHGEITIDPESGTIFSLTVQADLKGYLPILRSDVMVTYGPMNIGGKLYSCPTRSISSMTMRSVQVRRSWGEGFLTYGPYETALIDFVFDQYHMFRSNSRVLAEPPTVPE